MTHPLALVTGASRGIGRAIALELARAGHDVIGTCRSRTDDLGTLGEEVRALGRAFHGAAFDVGDAAAAESALRPVLAAAGSPGVLVSNAGTTRDGLFAMAPLEDWHAVLDANLSGFAHVTSLVVRGMIGRRAGRIVAIGSASGQMGVAGQVGYAAAKAGLAGAAKSLARELGRFGITVNVVSPGLIETEMVPEGLAAHTLPQVPMGRLGRPEEVAAVVRFLCSEEASYVTGQVIGVNGGLC